MTALADELMTLVIMIFAILLVAGPWTKAGSPAFAMGVYQNILSWGVRHISRGLSNLSRRLLRRIGRGVSWFLGRTAQVLVTGITWIFFQIWRVIRLVAISIGISAVFLWRGGWRLYGRAAVRWPRGSAMAFGAIVAVGITLSLFIIFS